MFIYIMKLFKQVFFDLTKSVLPTKLAVSPISDKQEWTIQIPNLFDIRILTVFSIYNYNIYAFNTQICRKK